MISWFVVITVIAWATLAGEASGQVSKEAPGWFPFSMSPLDVPNDAPMDVSFLNADNASHRIRVQGEYFVAGDSERIRFFGTNVTFSGAFPDKESAPAIARRMAQLGFNVVRFHHMDARDIWLPGQKSLDPRKLDRLDWFLYQLKQNGIYANINLHVSRTYPSMQGMDLHRAFRYGKILDTFHPPYIRLQEKYARDLLDRVNPYTNLRLAEDPAIAFVELNNENTLLNLRGATLAELPDPFRRSLRAQWREWLENEYGQVDRMADAWNRDVVPLGPEILKNGDFSAGTAQWRLEGRKPGVCEMDVTPASGEPALHVRMTEKGDVSWAYQVHQMGIELENGMPYTIRFRGRAEPARRVSVSLRFAEEPWTIVSGSQNVELTPQWQEFVLPARVNGIEPDKTLRFSLNLGDSVGEVQLADTSVRVGRRPFDPPAEGISAVQLPGAQWPSRAHADFRRFLVATEREYVTRLKQFLTEELDVQSLIVDTQASYGGFWGLYREATLGDYLDMHSYWQHPRFPGRPWDPSNWTIPNTSMVAADDGGTFHRLATNCIEGAPFSVSEYNHPAPNDHAAELFPLLATFGCHQDWDALYQFCYGNREEAYEDGRIRSYFGLATHSGQLVFAPLAALAFRQALIPAAKEKTVLEVPRPWLDDSLERGWPGLDFLEGDAAPALETILGSRFRVQFTDTGNRPALYGGMPKLPEGELIQQGGMNWRTGANHAVFTATAPAARIAVGQLGDKELALGDVKLHIGLKENSWACFAATAVDGQPLSDSEKVLLALVQRVENTNMDWNKQRTSVGRDWGESPVVARGVPAELIWPGESRPTVTALTPAGTRGETASVTGTTDAWKVTLGPELKTLWYVVER
ncbi:MAG: carbohydrate binding domain-containing protein [Planctomycetota bacterium]